MMLRMLVVPAVCAAAAAQPPDYVGPYGNTFCSSLPSGVRLFTKDSNVLDTVEKCAELCTATPSCVCFDYKRHARSGCRGVNQVKLKHSADYEAFVNSSAHPPPMPPPGPPPPPRGGSWSQLWLDYHPARKTTRSGAGQLKQLYCGNTTADGILGNACAELLAGLEGMLGQRLTLVTQVSADGALVLRAGNATTSWPPNTAAEAFQIGSGRAAPSCLGHSCTLISGPSEVAVLYGVFRFLSAVRRDVPSTVGNAQPRTPLRVWDLWDNIDGSVERGYAGKSIFDWEALPSLSPRYRDYARLLASVGINAIVWDNVNACESGNQHILERAYLHKLAPLAELFASYGIVTLITPCFTSPQTVGNLSTADPLEPAVIAWWRAKVEEIAAAIPSFRGFLSKADAEGQPGPMKYNRTELDGANLFGDVLGALPGLGAPGVAIWRSFSHPNYRAPAPMNDQAYFQYQRFASFDGKFRDNVILQSKNGPFDFQVREPVHSLFGHMTQTNQMVEFEATQEYLGQAKHVCHLAPQWKTYLETDLAIHGGVNTTLADVVSGQPLAQEGRGRQHGAAAAAAAHQFAGTAAVSNLGDDPNWTGHEFSAAITYAYGRLSWDPTLTAAEVTREWVDSTWSPVDEAASNAMVSLLMSSWEAYENYTAPLGVGFICSGDHYEPDPAHRQSLLNATQTHLGYDRPAYGRTYNGRLARSLSSPATTPEDLLLCFHNVPYTYKLSGAHGNLRLIDYIYASHKAGAATAASYVETWKSLHGKLDYSAYGGAQAYDVVLKRLEFGASEAQRFSDIVTSYFAKLTGIPVPPL